MRTSSRRRLLGVVAAAAVPGCAGQSTESDGTTTGEPTDTTDTATAGQTGTPPTAASGSRTPRLDLREANVVEVAVEGDGASRRFDVTLYHDDDGESGYANWWQVERLDGTRLGRRNLSHAHGTRPFTRSTTVDVPAGTACVVVRGHDRTHGYGGRAAVVSLDDGQTRPVDQGPERRPVDAGECP